MVENAICESKINRSRILGIGVGAPGKVDISTGTVLFYDRIAGLSDFSLRDRLSSLFDIPVFVNNNCSVIAMNEYLYGLVSESKSLVTLLIRSGVGGAFINEGKVMTTNGITTMEVGHTSLDYNGRLCECGEKGCLQSYLAEPAVLRDLKEIEEIGSFMEIDRLIDSDNEKLEDFFRKKAEQLSKALKMLSRIFSPDTFLIISRSPRYAEKLVQYSRQIMENDPCKFDNIEGLKIVHSSYNPVHAGQGASDMVFTDYFTS
jgi:predicted NBD/HSP70 family sugar kinase